MGFRCPHSSCINTTFLLQVTCGPDILHLCALVESEAVTVNQELTAELDKASVALANVHNNKPYSSLRRTHHARVQRLNHWPGIMWSLLGSSPPSSLSHRLFNYFRYRIYTYKFNRACGCLLHSEPEWRSVLCSAPVRRQWLHSRDVRRVHLRFAVERSNEDGATHTKVATEAERTEDSYYNTELNLNFKDCDKKIDFFKITIINHNWMVKS